VNAALTLYGIELTESDVRAIYDLRNQRLRDDGYDLRGYPLREGAADMIRELTSAGDMLTIVTSETIAHAQRTLSLGGIEHLFACVVGRDLMVDGREILKKPHHEPYQVAHSLIEKLSGLELLHIGAEDTAPGIESLVGAKNNGFIQEAVHVKGIQSAHDVTNQLTLQAVEQRTPQGWQAELLLLDATYGEFSEKLREMRI
jgi:beta-phosphoglucomutase-like phosphatase (HAD superfamily)